MPAHRRISHARWKNETREKAHVPASPGSVATGANSKASLSDSLRNQALSEKRNIWEDMLAVLEHLGKPITEKQRGFFLPK